MKWKADLSGTEEVLRGVNVKGKVRERLDTLYQLNARGALGVSAFLRSKIQAGSTKVKRYVERSVQFHQNNLFKNDQSNLYKELNGSRNKNNPAPDAAEATQYWRGIYSERREHVRNAEWLEKVKDKLRDTRRQDNVIVYLQE